MRTAVIDRKTKETDIHVELNLDGGETDISTGIGFFDHMLTAFSVHGGFGLTVKAVGDLQIWFFLCTDGRSIGILFIGHKRQTVSCV